MQILLTKPELEKFVAEQVSAGRFPSPEAVIEAGLARLMEDPDDGLDDETLDAIEEGNRQIDNGEGIDFKEFAAAMRKKYCGK
jgi:Arc/MetJ-type ribon-helix-helix transcriptional regulator